ncbi:VOC family protein [Phenylobacterium sp. LjRoot219]|uniref:VOC family protein n=1 Tax=Phenylobacterium sp. LjRoot219 TaxID=3342283 RepID=UPI003ED07ECD
MILWRHLAVAAIAAGMAAGTAQAQPAGAPAINMPVAKGATIMSAAFHVSDLDRAVDFYTKGLGVKVGGRIEHPTLSEIVLMFPGSSTSLLLIQPKTRPAAAEGRRLGRIIVLVPDLRATQAKLEAAGYRLQSPITEQKDFKLSVAVAVDPDGNELELIQGG